MRTLFFLHHALLFLILFDPLPSFDQSFRSPSGVEWPLAHGQEPSNGLHPVVASDEARAEPSKDGSLDGEDRHTREIQRFTEPRIRLRGSAEDIGLDSRTLVSVLEKKFLKDFSFLQNDFAFDKTYETWEIGLFECEAWTVGSRYPIALHVQCAGGSMDEPRHWQSASLGYGPKDKIVEMVKKTLETIVADYASYVRTAHMRNES
jgi:hypothetical protein